MGLGFLIKREEPLSCNKLTEMTLAFIKIPLKLLDLPKRSFSFINEQFRISCWGDFYSQIFGAVCSTVFVVSHFLVILWILKKKYLGLAVIYYLYFHYYFLIIIYFGFLS